jgi:hypothetical protein
VRKDDARWCKYEERRPIRIVTLGGEGGGARIPVQAIRLLVYEDNEGR